MDQPVYEYSPPPTPLGPKKQQPGCPFKWTMFLPFTLSFSAAGKKKKTETPLASTRHVKTILMLPISCEQNKYEKKNNDDYVQASNAWFKISYRLLLIDFPRFLWFNAPEWMSGGSLALGVCLLGRKLKVGGSTNAIYFCLQNRNLFLGLSLTFIACI